MKKILLDTNILIYASYAGGEFYEQAVRVIEKSFDREDRYFIAQNSLYELYRVLTSPAFSRFLPHLKAIEIYRFYAHESGCVILSTTKETPSILEQLLSPNVRSGHIFDMLLVAQMLENEISVLYTKNTKDFAGVEGVEVIDPTV